MYNGKPSLVSRSCTATKGKLNVTRSVLVSIWSGIKISEYSLILTEVKAVSGIH